MIDRIGDEFGKSPIHRLFEKGEDDIALEYLISSHKDGFKIIGISEDGEEQGFMPEEFMDTVYKSFMKSMYGINIVTIANMWKVQTIFIDKYYPLLMDYLQYAGAKVEYYEFVPNSIAIPFMGFKSREGIIEPQSRWNPLSEWKTMYVEDKDANLVSPFNIFINAKIVFTDPSEEFLEAVVPNESQRDLLKKTAEEKKSSIKLLYTLLPNDNFNKILNVIDIVHRYI